MTPTTAKSRAKDALEEVTAVELLVLDAAEEAARAVVMGSMAQLIVLKRSIRSEFQKLRAALREAS